MRNKIGIYFARMATLIDHLELTDRAITPEGYLHATARLSRVGVQEYMASELRGGGHNVPAAWPNDSIVRLFRSESEVFSQDSLASVMLKPVTVDHPSKFVTSENVKFHQVGLVISEPRRDGDFVVADLLVQDGAAVREIQKGRKQISLGYNLDVNWTPGVDATYGVFDGQQTNLRVNHVAIVLVGRAGPEAKILDGDKKMTEKRIVDGLAVELDDVGTRAVDKLASQIETLTARLADSSAALDAAKAAADKAAGEKAALESEATKLRELTGPEALDALVAKRLTLIDAARKLAKDVDFSGKTEREVKVLALAAWDKDCDLTDKSDEYVDGVFAVAVKAAPASASNLDATLRDAANSQASLEDARTAGVKKLQTQTEKKFWDK